MTQKNSNSGTQSTIFKLKNWPDPYPRHPISSFLYMTTIQTTAASLAIVLGNVIAYASELPDSDINSSLIAAAVLGAALSSLSTRGLAHLLNYSPYIGLYITLGCVCICCHTCCYPCNRDNPKTEANTAEWPWGNSLRTNLAERPALKFAVFQALPFLVAGITGLYWGQLAGIMEDVTAKRCAWSAIGVVLTGIFLGSVYYLTPSNSTVNTNYHAMSDAEQAEAGISRQVQRNGVAGSGSRTSSSASENGHGIVIPVAS